jgi:hypothetical protein
VLLTLPPAKQRLGLLGPLGVLLLNLAEELHYLSIALSLSVLDVLGVHLPAFGGVVEDATEVEDRIAYPCELLCGSGHCAVSHLSLSSSCSLTTTTTSYIHLPTTLRGEAKPLENTSWEDG